jgi:hypothetical protein
MIIDKIGTDSSVLKRRWKPRGNKKFFIPPDDKLVGRQYSVVGINSSHIDDLINKTIGAMQVIVNNFSYIDVYKIYVEMCPKHLYSKMYTFFQNNRYHDDSIISIDVLLNERINETVYNTKTEKPMHIIFYRFNDLNQTLTSISQRLYEEKNIIGYNNIYKIEHAINFNTENYCSSYYILNLS